MKICTAFFAIFFIFASCNEKLQQLEPSSVDGGYVEKQHTEKKPEEQTENLSCEEAISLFRKLSVSEVDLSCRSENDCVVLGSVGDCDCYRTIIFGGPIVYSKNNSLLVKLHDRIFSDNECLTPFILPCNYDRWRGSEHYTIVCENKLCKLQGEQNPMCRR